MVEKCCCFLPLHSGSLLVGVITLMVSTIIGIYSVVLLGLEQSRPSLGANHLKNLIHLDLTSHTVKIILTCIIIIQLLWMTFSILLIIGLKKNRPSFLLGYFTFGIVMTILMMLSGLLVILEQHWILSLIQFISAAVYTHGLVVVHHDYEMMQQNYERWREDEDHLWNPEENSNYAQNSVQ